MLHIGTSSLSVKTGGNETRTGKIKKESKEYIMPHRITRLCLRDSGCVDVCPVDCIVPGEPVDQWPWYYIDADACIDCGACEAECPYAAIFPEEDVPDAYEAKGGEVISMPKGTPGYDQVYEGENAMGDEVKLDFTRTLDAGEVIDLTEDIDQNTEFFESGPGYSVLEG